MRRRLLTSESGAGNPTQELHEHEDGSVTLQMVVRGLNDFEALGVGVWKRGGGEGATGVEEDGGRRGRTHEL